MATPISSGDSFPIRREPTLESQHDLVANTTDQIGIQLLSDQSKVGNNPPPTLEDRVSVLKDRAQQCSSPLKDVTNLGEQVLTNQKTTHSGEVHQVEKVESTPLLEKSDSEIANEVKILDSLGFEITKKKNLS